MKEDILNSLAEVDIFLLALRRNVHLRKFSQIKLPTQRNWEPDWRIDMLISELVICELCGATFKSCLNVAICSNCSSGAKRALPDDQYSLNNAKRKRQEAKSVGLKALSGTAKQKSWGETIRKQLIDNINTSSTVAKEDGIAVYELLTSSIFKSAVFWIDQRSNLVELQLNLVKAVQLKSKANSMYANGESNSTEYHIVANQYQAIIDKF